MGGRRSLCDRRGNGRGERERDGRRETVKTMPRDSTTLTFVIVGEETPIYECEIKAGAKKEETVNYLHEFVLHAALDNIEEAIWTTQSCYLKAVDRYYDLTVSAYATSSLVKFLLLHDSKNDDGIRSFFHDIHEYYIKIMLNPFHTQTTKITSKHFDDKVKALAQKYLL